MERSAAFIFGLSLNICVNLHMAAIEVISPYDVIYSRDEGFEENRLFSDPNGRLAIFP
jgi:hypothetical protein